MPALLPVLDDLGQDVSVEIDDKGRPTRTLHHMLKVFLIDPRGTVREIYTLAYLQPEVMLNDIRTLHMERTLARFSARRGPARRARIPRDGVAHPLLLDQTTPCRLDTWRSNGWTT